MTNQRRIGLFLTLLMLSLLATGLLAVGGSPRGEAAPAAVPAAQVPPVRVECGPPEVDGWVIVEDYLAWSGCVTWECWSSWIYNDPSNALMEKQPRLSFFSHGSSNPGSPWPGPASIYDGRQLCADGERAAGYWYHNGNARPVFRYRSFPGDPPWLECMWVMEPAWDQTWSFGEEDDCPMCELDPVATPAATVCGDHPLYIPTVPPPTPPPVILNPPDLLARAQVRSTVWGGGTWYSTDTTKGYFYWPFQHVLGIRFGGSPIEPSAGCTAASAVTRYLFRGAGDREVCRMGDPGTGAPPMPEQTACLDPAGCCEWHEVGDDGLRLLFRQNEQPYPSSAEAGLFFWGFKPGPVELRYTVEVVTTYWCTGEETYRQVTWYFDRSLTANLVKSTLRR